MAYWASNGRVTDDVTWPPKGQTRDPNTLRAQYLENSCRCYYFSNNCWLLVCSLCCEAVRSAILATAWLPVDSMATIRTGSIKTIANRSCSHVLEGELLSVYSVSSKNSKYIFWKVVRLR